MNNRADDNGEYEYTSSMTQFAIAMKLHELVEHMTVTGRFGYHTGTNIVANDGPGVGNTDNQVWDSYDAANNGLTQTTMGYEVDVDYWGLALKYGVYERDLGTGEDGTTAASKFSVGYKVTF